MKKYIFIIFIFLLAYEAYPQVRLSTMTQVTALDTADLFWVNEFVTPNYLNRRLRWKELRSNMIDYIDGLENTWASRQTFSSGATFSAGSNGTVTFADTVASSHAMTGKLYLPYDVTSQVGIPSAPMFRIHTKDIRLYNTELNDSTIINYDDSTLTFNKEVSIPNLKVTTSLEVDSAVTSPTWKISPNSYQIDNVTDSILVIDTLMSNVLLLLPGDVVSPGIEKITMSTAPEGHIVVFYITTTSDSVVFQDSNADGNLRMAGDFNMNVHDNIAFMYIKDLDAGEYYWIELWRKDN